MNGRVAIRSTSIYPMTGGSEPLDGFVLVADGRILDVVSREWAPRPGETWTVIDGGSGSVVPGFIDPHVHIEHTANAVFGAVDCHTPPNSDIDELIGTLRSNTHLADARGGWLIGQGGLFADRRFSDGRLPNRFDLDRVSSTLPVAVRFGFHVTVLNSAGLRLALEAGLKDSDGGHIIYGDDGQPTGVIHELYHALPIPHFSDRLLQEAIASTTAEHLTSYGVTTFGEISNTARDLAALDLLVADGRVPQEVHAFLWTPGTRTIDRVFDVESWDDLGIERPRALTLAGVKIFADGGFSAAGAAVLRPYASGNLRAGHPRGNLSFTDEELVALVRRADDAGLQLIAHTNGERAQRQLSDAARTARGGDRGDRKPVRLEHAGNVVTDWETLDHWERGEIVPVAQAGFIWTMGSYIPEYLGDYSRTGMFPFRSLIERGWPVASSSDGAASEMAQFNPLFGVGRALDRRGYAGDLVAIDESIGLVDALAMHTSSAAEALGLGHDRGRLVTGHRADIAVLSEDLATIAPDRLGDVVASQVLIEGRPIHGTSRQDSHEGRGSTSVFAG
ncbi:MAG: amidohydrolase [Rhodoglobus sp.]|nr:amidohydrolase [Rhodoglobus sp.]